jgi:hypothetical protein
MWLVQITAEPVDQVIPSDFISTAELSKGLANIKVCIPH